MKTVVQIPGDIIFYDWNDNGVGDNTGWADHVGIVEKVSNNTVTVIEGNYSNSVKRRKIAMNAKTIRGYGVPRYDTTPTKSIEQIAREVIRGKWGNGQTRKNKLTSAGYNCDEVQRYVNKLLKD